MDLDRENELLMHIAAGTDLPTALAALPQEDESPVESPAEPSKQNSSYGWVAFAALVFIALLLLLR
jgi:hypothetical protein